MKIKLTRNLGGHKAGDTITATPKTADYLITLGHAEPTKAATKKPSAKSNTTSNEEGVGGTPSDS